MKFCWKSDQLLLRAGVGKNHGIERPMDELGA